MPPKDLRTSPAFQRLMESFWAYAVADIMYCVCVRARARACVRALTWAVNSNLAQSKVCKRFWLPNLLLRNIYCTFQVQVCLQEWILQGRNCYGQPCEENCKSYILFVLHVWMLELYSILNYRLLLHCGNINILCAQFQKKTLTDSVWYL